MLLKTLFASLALLGTITAAPTESLDKRDDVPPDAAAGRPYAGPPLGKLPGELRAQVEDYFAKSRGSISTWDVQDDGPVAVAAYAPNCFQQKRSHFDKNAPAGTFCQRYWYSTKYYKPGGPVILLDAGEASGEGQVGFMDRGAPQILGEATNGLLIVLEHRYYGGSFPIEKLDTDGLRYLNNDEAIQDSVEFIKNFPVPDGLGLAADALKPHKTPWIYMGGSYPGGRAAFMRKEHSDIVWGAISSSGVTHAQVEYPEYRKGIMQFGNQTCINAMSEAIEQIDAMLTASPSENYKIKSLFGLQELEDDDFADALDSPLGQFQRLNWVNEVNNKPQGWNLWCNNLTDPTVQGANLNGTNVTPSVIAYADYFKQNYLTGDCGKNVTDCFSTHNLIGQDFDTSTASYTWRSWLYQTCTQWGYYAVHDKEGERTIISKYKDISIAQRFCAAYFPPGKLNQTPPFPDLDIKNTNDRGDFNGYHNIPRLAMFGGEMDPWRPATPLCDDYWCDYRENTVKTPTLVIPGGVHCWDLFNVDNATLAPQWVKDLHKWEIHFVKEWLAEFGRCKAKH